MREVRFVEAKLDDLPAGTMVYSAPGIPVGVVRDYLAMNGNGPPIPERHLDDGKPAHRFAWRREILYRQFQDRVVFVKEEPHA